MSKQIKGVEKFIPEEGRVYLVTDSCFWIENSPKDYNFSDPKRKPHSMQLVEISTGTIVNLPSRSLVKIVKV